MTSLTSVTFENATVSEAVKRLMRVAPTKGEAYDKAAGIVIEVRPGQPWPITMKVTNLSLYYLEWVGVIGCVGEPLTWRVPAETFSQIITKLPIASGRTVEFTQVENKLHVVSGKFKASISMISSGYYPDWEPFDPEQTAPVKELGSKIDQVAWAAVKRVGGDAMNGIRLNGKTLAATDRYVLASVPCEAEHINQEVVFQAGSLSSLVNGSGETRVGMVGDQLLLIPNDHTQIRCIALAADFPNVERIMCRDHTNSIKVNKTQVLDAIARVSSTDHRSRMPQMSMFIGDETIAVYVEEEMGSDRSIEVLDYPGQAIHDKCRIFMSPQSLIDTMTAAPSDYVEIFYDQANALKLVRITGDLGYESWVAPKSGIRTAVEE